MGLAAALIALTWVSLTVYALFAGADFGAGLWDLLAGGTERGRRPRARIEHSIGPVWEANHVWLIFVLVLLWTAFPPVFAAVASTLYLPFMLVAIGIIARGSAFAFRKAVTEMWQQRLFGAAFAASSVITPFFLGAMAGGVASGRVPPGVAAGDVITSWVNPTSLVCGVLAVGVCAYLSAVYLTADARRAGEEDLADYFRTRALATGLAVGAVAVVGLVVVHQDAPDLFHAVTHGGLVLVVISMVAGVCSLGLLGVRAYTSVRITAAVAVVGVLWAWGIGQQPQLLPGLSIDQAAAADATLQATTFSAVVGLLLLLPSMAWLLVLFQREPADETKARP